MKKEQPAGIMLAIMCMLAVSVLQAQDVQIHYFNFNAAVPESGANWEQPVKATIGSGTLVYTFGQAVSFAGTTINGNEGEVNGGSFCPQGGPDNANDGKHFDLRLPVKGYENIVVTYPTRRTTTGFTRHAVQYTIDGENWLEFDVFDISAYANNWVADQLITLDFRSIAAVNDNPAFAIRFVLSGVTSTAGNNRFDNISVRGTAAGSTDVAEAMPEHQLSVFPNPAYHTLYIYAGFGIDMLTLTDMSGKMVYVSTPGSTGPTEATIDVSGFSTGLYVLRTISGNHMLSRKIQIGN